MKIAQSTLRKVIQEEIEKVREAPTSDMAELVNRASAQIDMLLNDLLARFRGDEGVPSLHGDALQLFDDIKKLHDEYIKVKPVNRDDLEQIKREQEPERYRYEDDE